jgi:hypothetical protein
MCIAADIVMQLVAAAAPKVTAKSGAMEIVAGPTSGASRISAEQHFFWPVEKRAHVD